MHEFYELKELLMEEVKKIAKKGELTAGSLETVDKLLNSIKNACKIIMYEEYSDEGEYSQESGYAQEGGMSYRGGNSYARGRGSNARRDSMGRYSREGGNSYARGNRGGYSRTGYSYDDGENEEKIEMLRDMMQEVSSDEERRALQKLIRRMEQQ